MKRVCPVFGKEFYKLGSSVDTLSKTFALDTHKGMASCHIVSVYFRNRRQ